MEVCANHVRRVLLQPYSDLQHPSLVDTAIYFATSFAHQAVVVFFVLSGFLVGGSVHQLHGCHRWSWSGYAVQRLSRLWAVLVPCLVLTLVWDFLGAKLGGGRGYDGALADMMFFGTKDNPPLDHSWPTILGNLFFVQDIVTPMLGSNLALWSLANEFWYYVIFPLGFFAWKKGTPLSRRVAPASMAALICFAMPRSILEGGVVWLFGYFGWLTVRSKRVSHALTRPASCVALSLLLVASLASVKRGSWLAHDWMLGLVVTLLLPMLVSAGRYVEMLRGIATRLSDISYSLYLSHFSLLAFVIFGLMQRDHLAPQASSYAMYGALMALLVGYAALVWFCFEKRTSTVRQWMTVTLQRLRRNVETVTHSALPQPSAKQP